MQLSVERPAQRDASRVDRGEVQRDEDVGQPAACGELLVVRQVADFLETRRLLQLLKQIQPDALHQRVIGAVEDRDRTGH